LEIIKQSWFKRRTGNGRTCKRLNFANTCRQPKHK